MRLGPTGSWFQWSCVLLLLGSGNWQLIGQNAYSLLPSFDFKSIADVATWSSVNIASLTPTPEGLILQIAGPGPSLLGPRRDFPGNQPLWLVLRLKSEQGGIGRVFYFKNQVKEADSVEFEAPAGQWHQTRLPLPPLEGRWEFGLEPPGSGGLCMLDRLWFEDRLSTGPSTAPPPTGPPAPPEIGADALTVRSGDLELIHDRRAMGAFEIKVAGRAVAVGNQPPICYFTGSAQESLDMGRSSQTSLRFEQEGIAVRLVCQALDREGARWTAEQRFTPAAQSGAIQVESSFSVDRDRRVASFPFLTLLPGLGSFGNHKTQALFCGLEYLEDEPSSSEADVTGPEAQRQVPESGKITFPLMAIAADDRFLGMVWQPNSNSCAIFDSPDRIFGANGHFMGLFFPASVRLHAWGPLRAYRGVLVRSNESVTVRATIIGGRGATVVPAIQQYVQLRGLPPAPVPKLTFQEYIRSAAHGWLESEICRNGLFRHSTSPETGAYAAADAAVWMRWLSEKTGDPALGKRLAEGAQTAFERLPSLHNCNDHRIGHIPTPLPALIYNVAISNTVSAQANARGLLVSFEADGTLVYKPTPGGIDYGRTHFASEANGHTAASVVQLLRWALFAGDRTLLDTALHHLRAMNKFRKTVPRGATSWLPLHAPDLQAAAQLLRCYTLGYELTGDPEFLEQARYWAWTGLPFVYLVSAADGAVGAYGTIGALCAVDWKWPLFGLVNAWPGLIYADALYGFSKFDSSGPWRKLADGITAAGIQQCWPADEPSYGGLLPSTFQLSTQTRQAPAINPATLQVNALRYFGQTPPYDFHAFRAHGLLVHAPGELSEMSETREGITFRVRTWLTLPSSLLITGFRKEPQIRLNGQEVQITPPHEYQSSTGRLELRLQGAARLDILCPEASGIGPQ